MANRKTTSGSVATAAAKVLSNPNSIKIAKQIAASALSQVNKGNETSKKVETAAGKVLTNPKSRLIDIKIAA